MKDPTTLLASPAESWLPELPGGPNEDRGWFCTGHRHSANPSFLGTSFYKRTGPVDGWCYFDLSWAQLTLGSCSDSFLEWSSLLTGPQVSEGRGPCTQPPRAHLRERLICQTRPRGSRHQTGPGSAQGTHLIVVYACALGCSPFSSFLPSSPYTN